MGSAFGSRRERQREQLLTDTRRAARKIAATEGIDGLTLAAVARAVGVSPPALYRYFEGRDGLVRALYDDLTAELISTVVAAAERQNADDLSAQLHAATFAVFDWALTNRAAFDLLMGSAYPKASKSGGDVPQVIARELGSVFAKPFEQLWRHGGLAYPTDDELPVALRGQLEAYRAQVCPHLPAGVAYLMITCWRQIYGITCMAVYGHLDYAFDDHRALFDDMIASLLGLLGLSVSPGLR
ncbi:TetR/AcrR family transcriptional regulator [Streptomyces sp. RLA2-12]|nr:TetR/AcrR family transcriptional regulator [Streptomyces sp. RLA2-12]QDN64252.1 TetR/AcrR family transcriptional regulator [Streptomyces sp. S1D4-20]QDN74295.1 TetR/AcrR family transcriptional regulator [Streptomyces sp. S1D4-14]QDO56898.1 TetR/AcrR family transcriptional regulator [Streptomyces sp. RLB3-5]QDO65687.1 TetR/AcrR family transcriptional regulator [Streptomyces sp. RLB1-8]